MQHKGLGKGLEALIPALRAGGDSIAPGKGEAVLKVDINKIRPNKFQPRKLIKDDKLAELANSIRENGIIQPLLVSETSVTGEYELIAGERRLRAAKSVKLKEVPVLVRKVNDREKLIIAMIENINRDDINPIDEANGYKRLTKEFECTQEQVAKMFGKDRTVITNSIRLLELSPDIQFMIAEGAVSPGAARALLGINDKQKQDELIKRILKEKLTVRDIENIAKDWKSTVSKFKKRKKSPEIISLEDDLQRTLGTKVQIVARGKQGKVVIHYYSLDDLDRLIKSLKKSVK